MLKLEQLQAVRYMYEGRDVSLWLITGFVNPSAMKFSLVLRHPHKAAMCEEPGYEATMMFPPHKAALWEGPGHVQCFLRREKQNMLRMCKQCVPGPLSALWEGPGYEAKHVHDASSYTCTCTCRRAVRESCTPTQVCQNSCLIWVHTSHIIISTWKR